MRSLISILVITTMMILTITSCKKKDSKIITIGHRGARGHVAENTIASIQKALDLNVDAIEIDIFRCATGELVVFHDQTIDELTDGKGFIEQMSLDSIKQFRVLGKEHIPTLKEVMDLIDGRVQLNIELKGTQTAELTSELINTYFEQTNWDSKDIFISSFNWEELELFYKINKEVAIALLTEDDPADAILVAKKLDAFAINPNHENLNAQNIIKIQNAGLKIYPWTVNDPSAISQMINFGVDGIITDFPERVHEKINISLE